MAYNKITLYGRQTCDYIYIQNDMPEADAFDSVNDEPTSWNDTTTLFANFNDKSKRLSAGDTAIIGDITGYEVYRRTVSSVS